MSVVYPTSAVPAIRESRRRKHEYTDNGNDSYEDFQPAAKRHSYLVCNTTPAVWPDFSESSPKSPESGIDMSDLGSSPCYSMTTRTSTHPHYEAVPEVSMLNAPELQQEQYKKGFYLAIIDEPEENYRARYDSEGCRGPMKGRNGGCPTVQISSNQLPWTEADIKVELVAADKSPLNSCKLDSTEEGSNLLKKAHPGEKVSFENLRIRRLKKGDANNKSTGRQMSNQSKLVAKTTRGKQDEKVAHLLFTARIRGSYATEEIELKVLSQAIHLNASHDPPEIHYVVPQYGTSGDPVAIIGTRMHSPRVSFIVRVDGKEQEIQADINKEVSHQNALVVKIPQLPLNSYSNSIANVHICVTAGKGDRTGKEPLKSMPVQFYCVVQGCCKECVMTSQHQPSLVEKFSGFMFQPQSSPYLYRQSHTQHSTGQSPVPMIVQKPSMIAPTPRRVITPPKCASPLPPAVSKSPGYNSPSPSQQLSQANGNYKMSIPATYQSYPVSCAPLTINSCTSSPPLVTIQSSGDPSSAHHHQQQQQQQQQQSPDEVDDIISSICDQPNPSESCPITPGSVSHSPQTSSPPCYITHSPNAAMHPSDQLMEEIGFSEQQAGPVSPDEFNRYLPKHSQVVSTPFRPPSVVSSSSTLGEYTRAGYYSSSSGVQPCSLGPFFPQNP